MPPPGVKPAATRKSITDQLLAGDIPRDQARAAIESGNIDGAIDALVNSQAPAAAPMVVAATVARPETPSGVVSTLGGAAPPAVAAPAAPADEQATDAARMVDVDGHADGGPPTPRSTRDAVGAVIDAVEGLAPPSAGKRGKKSERDDEGKQTSAPNARSPLRRVPGTGITSPQKKKALVAAEESSDDEGLLR